MDDYLILWIIVGPVLFPVITIGASTFLKYRKRIVSARILLLSSTATTIFSFFTVSFYLFVYREDDTGIALIFVPFLSLFVHLLSLAFGHAINSAFWFLFRDFDQGISKKIDIVAYGLLLTTIILYCAIWLVFLRPFLHL